MSRELLKKFGYEGDNCMAAILEWMSERRGTWVNKAELSLQRFPYKEKGVVKYFSPETISRKARTLAELGLLERDEVNHTATYRLAVEVPRRVEYKQEVIIKDGVRVMRMVPVTH